MRDSYLEGMQSDEKLVIIPDIHNKYPVAEKIIKMECPDRVLFLGDYFDDFYDTLDDADNTAKWLIKSLRQKNRTHLIGNHDLSYMTYNQNLKCTGYSSDKHEVIRGNNIPWDRLKLFYWADDWLCTHAGLANEFYKQQQLGGSDSVHEVLERSRRDLENIHDVNYAHAFFQAGFSRGGTSPVGGILWCHYGEFVDVHGIKQIFGHTRDSTVRHKKTKYSEHYCIDTQLNHYAVYENSAMRVRPVGFSDF